ncbi:MAG: hypothetical protein JNG90_02185, partial [Planctomycetaceae bacterium]|nr:hypothetical protein [Planctomycetaceae bacterium]
GQPPYRVQEELLRNSQDADSNGERLESLPLGRPVSNGDDTLGVPIAAESSG